MLSSVVNAVLGVPGPVAYVLIGLLAFGESAAFIGLFLPGETALLIGGVLAARGSISLPALLVLAVVAALAGDSVGYEVGRRGGRALQRTRLGRLIGDRRWDKAEQFVAHRGGTAVFVGRWVGVMRPLVPSLAGMGRMPYRRFLFYNVAGGILWACAVVLGGYAAGSSVRRIEQLLGRGSLVLGLALALGAATWLVTQRIVRPHRRRPTPPDRRSLVPRRVAVQWSLVTKCPTAQLEHHRRAPGPRDQAEISATTADKQLRPGIVRD
ncbi:MAG: rane-associated protein [Kribbellaceae bacterium]|nr:rane-associated protein [Kribbellaceae bacterium]